MISLHTWVDRLISKQLWLLALQHRNNTLKEKLLLIWSGLSWTESPPSEGHDWNVCSMPVVFQTKGDNTLSWSGLSWTESPPVLSRDMIEVCGPSRLYFKPRETILWVDLVWVEPSHPPCYWGTWSGCVFRAGCVSNRGRQHFELIWFELNRVTPVLPRDMIGVCVPSRLYFKQRETTLWVDLVWFDLVAWGLRLLKDTSLWCSSHAESTQGMTRLLSFSPLELFSGVPILTLHKETNRSKTCVWKRCFEWPSILVRLLSVTERGGVKAPLNIAQARGNVVFFFAVIYLPSLRHIIQKGSGEAWQSMGMVK
jgi:hypothetical protein